MTAQERKQQDVTRELNAMNLAAAELARKQVALVNDRRKLILKARKAGLTHQQIGDLLQMTKGRVSQIEKGIR